MTTKNEIKQIENSRNINNNIDAELRLKEFP